MSNYEYMMDKLNKAWCYARIVMEAPETAKKISEIQHDLMRLEGNDKEITKFYYRIYIPFKESYFLYF